MCLVSCVVCCAMCVVGFVLSVCLCHGCRLGSSGFQPTSSVEALIKNSDAHLDGCKLMLKRMRTLISWPRGAKHPLAEWLTDRGLSASMLRIRFQNLFRIAHNSEQFPTTYEHILKTGFARTTNKKHSSEQNVGVQIFSTHVFRFCVSSVFVN